MQKHAVFENKHRVLNEGLLSFCPRGFAIPEVIAADCKSARVADPQLITLWIANPQGQVLFLLIFFRPLAKKREEN